MPKNSGCSDHTEGHEHGHHVSSSVSSVGSTSSSISSRRGIGSGGGSHNGTWSVQESPCSPWDVAHGGVGSVCVQGDLIVEGSSNVHVGNDTHYHGPVTLVMSSNKTVNGLPVAASALGAAPNSTPSTTDNSSTTERWKVLGLKKFLHWPCVTVPVAVLATMTTLITIAFVYPRAACSGKYCSPPDQLVIVRRSEWKAWPSSDDLNQLQTPIQKVVVLHTETDACFEKASCTKLVKSIQQTQMDLGGYSDIEYNFLIGGDGVVYEGRGWDFTGAFLAGFNDESLGIALLGTFSASSYSPPTATQFGALKLMVQWGVDLGVVRDDYQLVGECQLRGKPCSSPGLLVMDDIKKWDHWLNYTVSTESCSALERSTCGYSDKSRWRTRRRAQIQNENKS